MDSGEVADEAASARHAQERGWLASIAVGGPPADVAMKALHERYQADFRAYLRRRGFREADIDDVTQRVWLDVARKAGRFARNGVPEAWLWSFLKNEMHDALRKDARLAARFTPANDETHHASETAVASSTPEKAKALRDLRDCVERAFSAFKRQHAHEAWWMYLRHVEDWDLDQVARHRGGSRHAAEVFLSRARRLFRDHVAPCLPLRAS